MTTEAGPEPGAQVDAGQVWRALGRLEGQVAALHHGQQAMREEFRQEMRESREESRQDTRETREEFRQEMRETRKRVDRLLYLGIATSLGLLGALIGIQLFG